jgi:hypothetical protein
MGKLLSLIKECNGHHSVKFVLQIPPLLNENPLPDATYSFFLSPGKFFGKFSAALSRLSVSRKQKRKNQRIPPKTAIRDRPATGTDASGVADAFPRPETSPIPIRFFPILTRTKGTALGRPSDGVQKF